jgi:hypothetical protein
VDHSQVFVILRDHLGDLVELARVFQNFVDADVDRESDAAI